MIRGGGEHQSLDASRYMVGGRNDGLFVLCNEYSPGEKHSSDNPAGRFPRILFSRFCMLWMNMKPTSILNESIAGVSGQSTIPMRGNMGFGWLYGNTAFIFKWF